MQQIGKYFNPAAREDNPNNAAYRLGQQEINFSKIGKYFNPATREDNPNNAAYLLAQNNISLTSTSISRMISLRNKIPNNFHLAKAKLANSKTVAKNYMDDKLKLIHKQHKKVPTFIKSNLNLNPYLGGAQTSIALYDMMYYKDKADKYAKEKNLDKFFRNDLKSIYAKNKAISAPLTSIPGISPYAKKMYSFNDFRTKHVKGLDTSMLSDKKYDYYKAKMKERALD